MQSCLFSSEIFCLKLKDSVFKNSILLDISSMSWKLFISYYRFRCGDDSSLLVVTLKFICVYWKSVTNRLRRRNFRGKWVFDECFKSKKGYFLFNCRNPCNDVSTLSSEMNRYHHFWKLDYIQILNQICISYFPWNKIIFSF